MIFSMNTIKLYLLNSGSIEECLVIVFGVERFSYKIGTKSQYCNLGQIMV